MSSTVGGATDKKARRNNLSHLKKGKDSWNDNENPYLAGYHCGESPRKRNRTSPAHMSGQSLTVHPVYTTKNLG